MRNALFGMVLFLLVGDVSGQVPSLPDEYFRFISSVSRIRTLEYKSTQYLLSAEDSQTPIDDLDQSKLREIGQFDAWLNFSTGNFRLLWDSGYGGMQELAFVEGVYYDLGHKIEGCTISAKTPDLVPWHWGMAQGYDIPDFWEPEKLAISSLYETFEAASNKIVLDTVVSEEHRNHQLSYRIRFEPKYGGLISSIIADTPAKTFERYCESAKFTRIDGIVLPLAYRKGGDRGKGGSYFVIDYPSIKINKPFSQPLIPNIPAHYSLVNTLEGTFRMGPKQQAAIDQRKALAANREQNKLRKNVFSRSITGNAWLFWIGLAGLTVAIGLGIFRFGTRKTAAILLVLVPSFSIGCDADRKDFSNHRNSSPVSVNPYGRLDPSASNPRTNTTVLRPLFSESDLRKTLEMNANRKDFLIEYPFVNASTNTYLLKADNLHASCGCSQPRWTKEKVSPNEKVSLVITIEDLPSLTSKPISVGWTLERYEPDQQTSLEVQTATESGTLSIFVDFDRGWTIQQDLVEVFGGVGEHGVARFEVQQPPGTQKPSLVFQNTQFDVSIIPTNVNDVQWFVELTTKEPLVLSQPLETIERISNVSASEGIITIPFRWNIINPVQWTPKVLVIERDAKAELLVAEVDAGWTIESLRSENACVNIQVSESNRDEEFSFEISASPACDFGRSELIGRYSHDTKAPFESVIPILIMEKSE